MAIHDSVINEMKAKPFTMVTILGMYVVVGLLWTGQDDYARAGEMAAVKQQLQHLARQVDRGNLETQLRAINSELFAVEQKMADIRSDGARPEQIYFDRLAALKSDKERITRELEALK